MQAVSKAQAVIEFNLDGSVITANENFLKTLGLPPGGDPGQAPQHVCRLRIPRQLGIQAVLARPERRKVPSGGVQAHRQGRSRGLDPGQLQPDLRPQRQSVQGREVRHGCHGDEAQERRLPGADPGHLQGPGGHRVQHGREHHHGQRQLPEDARLFPGRGQGPASRHVCRAFVPLERGVQAVLARPERRAIPGGRVQAHRQGRAGRSGSRAPTTPSSTSTESRSRW